jgi:hypothetical protein
MTTAAQIEANRLARWADQAAALLAELEPLLAGAMG